jgi:hypothetical protein
VSADATKLEEISKLGELYDEPAEKARRIAASRAVRDDSLAASRAKFVRKYRDNPKPWPDGIGAWYRAEDWVAGDDDHGDTLIATGEARARALDPWANMRARGEPCPPLPAIEVEPEPEPETDRAANESHEPSLTAESHVTAAESHAAEPHAEPWEVEGVSRATYFRRKRQAERKAGEASA